MENMQSVFRIKPSKQKSTIQIGSVSPGRLIVARPRRTHKKSRFGCQNCKRRRVKCDENKDDGCRNCRQHGIDCDYLDGSQEMPEPDDLPNLFNTSARKSLSATKKMSIPLTKVYPSINPVSSIAVQLPQDISPALQTMSYFELFTCSTVTSTAGLDIFKDTILALSHHRDYLMHAMLGMAAAHLTTIDSIASDSIQLQRFRKTESYHWHHALRLYRSELLNDAAVTHVDSLITTCMLTGSYSFFLTNSNETSFVNVPRSQRVEKLQWLIIPLGFPVVLSHVRQHIKSSAWFPLFNLAPPAEHDWTIKLDSAEGVFASFLELCGITPQNAVEPNHYKEALKDLFALLRVGVEQVSMRELAQLMAFMGRLRGRFYELLVELDCKALLIVLYWLVMLDNLDLWWVKTRSRVEAYAILEHLEFNNDHRIVAMLDIPKKRFRRPHNRLCIPSPATSGV